MELKAIIEKELEQNPVLEEVPSTAASDGGSETVEMSNDTRALADPAEPPSDLTYDPALAKPASGPVDDFDAEFERLAQIDEEWRSQLAEAEGIKSPTPEEEEKRRFLFDSLTAGPTLHQFLLEQVALSDLSKEDASLAELIIGNIDDNGYLKTTVEEIATEARTTPEKVLEVLKTVQSFDPPGVGARDVRECLLLQLERASRQNTLEYKIIQDYFNDLVKHRYPQIAKFLNVPVEEVQKAVQAIAQLDPKPGRQFAPDNEAYVVPDVYVTKVGEEYIVTLNEDFLPRLRISNVYKDVMTRTRIDLQPFSLAFQDAPSQIQTKVQMIQEAIKAGNDFKALELLQTLGNDPELTIDQQRQARELIAKVRERQSLEEAKKYIRDKIRAGKFLIKSIQQRQETILNIAKEIVNRQKEFFEKGIAHLKPMTMAQIAQAVGVHETTVSRAVSGKYMQTPQGLFEMKFFFTTGIPTEEGNALSNTTVKNMIAELFKNEDPRNPLSDQQIVEILRSRGIKIARRTVAKYRAELNILPSHLRKVY
jgi:RNA polymerase sigma-54 factor